MKVIENFKTQTEVLLEAKMFACSQLGYIANRQNISLLDSWHNFKQLVSDYMLTHIRGRATPIKGHKVRGNSEWKKLTISPSPLIFTYPLTLKKDTDKYKYLSTRLTTDDLDPVVYLELVNVLNIQSKLKTEAISRCFK